MGPPFGCTLGALLIPLFLAAFLLLPYAASLTSGDRPFARSPPEDSKKFWPRRLEKRDGVAYLRRAPRLPRGRGDRHPGRSPLAWKQKMCCALARVEVAHLRRMLWVPQDAGTANPAGPRWLACKTNLLCFATVSGETRLRGFLDDSGTGSAASPLRPAVKKSNSCFAVARCETRLRTCAEGFGLLETRGPAIRLVPAGPPTKNCFA